MAFLGSLLRALIWLVPITFLAIPLSGAVIGGIQAIPNIANIFAMLFQIIPFVLILPLFTTIANVVIPQIIGMIEKVRKRKEE